jgi:hypothetical protein
LSPELSLGTLTAQERLRILENVDVFADSSHLDGRCGLKEQITVVLYGNSLFIAGVEASLRDRLGLDVVRINATLPDAGQRLIALCPDVLILDLAAHHSEFAIPFLRKHPGLPVIDLDVTSNTVIVLSTQRYTALTVNDLAQVINMPIGLENTGTEHKEYQ